MNIIFMGTPDFALPTLDALYKNDYNIMSVVTQPDRPVGRKKELKPTPVKQWAIEHDIPVLQPEKLSQSEELQQIIEMHPDLIITAAFGQFLPQSLLDAPQYGCLNVHGSLLPKYRGGAPIQYAIMNGEKETGITIMEMVKKMDAGDMVAQEAIPITEKDDAGTIFDKLSQLGAKLLIQTIPQYISGEITPVSQEESKVTYAPNITREQEHIDWTKKASEIDCLIRALHPWPIAYTMWQGKRLKIWEAQVMDMETDNQPGMIISRDSQLLVACGEHTVLSLKLVQLAGKSKQSSDVFLNGAGRSMQVGEYFDE